jgi:hypothetical protein
VFTAHSRTPTTISVTTRLINGMQVLLSRVHPESTRGRVLGFYAYRVGFSVRR